MTDTPTFGRYAEIPYDEMTPEQQEGYRFLVETRGAAGGPQNYSFWDNQKFNDLTDQIDREVDPAKRLALVRQTEAIMEEDPPVLPVAWEKINDVWYNYVKGHNPYDYFGVYDVVREDTFWLDKA